MWTFGILEVNDRASRLLMPWMKLFAQSPSPTVPNCVESYTNAAETLILRSVGAIKAALFSGQLAMSICCPVGFTSALEAVSAQRQNTIPADGDIEKMSKGWLVLCIKTRKSLLHRSSGMNKSTLYKIDAA